MAKEKIKWVKYGNSEGPSYIGTEKFLPIGAWDDWTRILAVIASCEGNYDTVTMYDNTGVTWGFVQWTFTSGRLQRLLEYLKSQPVVYDEHPDGHPSQNLFDLAFHSGTGENKLREFGFAIISSRFVDLKNNVSLDPSADKSKIVDLCLGTAFYEKGSKDQIAHATGLAQVFADAGKHRQVQKAQIDFAVAELKAALVAKRPVLNGGTIQDFLPDMYADDFVSDIACAVFWNLWQNNPGAAYKLYSGVRWGKYGDGSDTTIFDAIWKKLNSSSFGNWGFKSKRYLEGKGEPRVVRIQKAVLEYYDYKLPLYRPSK